MQTAVLVAVIGALATLIAATIAHILQRRREHTLKGLQFKLDRYADFLGSFALLGSGNKTLEARVRIANAVNTMNLIASREVLEQVYSLLAYIQREDSTYSTMNRTRLSKGSFWRSGKTSDRGPPISEASVFARFRPRRTREIKHFAPSVRMRHHDST